MWRLTDHRETRYYPGFRGCRKARKRKAGDALPPLLTTIGDGMLEKYGAPATWVTTARPIELRVYGNDDTSYTKFYATVEAAWEEVALFESNQPLDFDEFVAFGFVFTN